MFVEKQVLIHRVLSAYLEFFKVFDYVFNKVSLYLKKVGYVDKENLQML